MIYYLNIQYFSTAFLIFKFDCHLKYIIRSKEKSITNDLTYFFFSNQGCYPTLARSIHYTTVSQRINNLRLAYYILTFCRITLEILYTKFDNLVHRNDSGLLSHIVAQLCQASLSRTYSCKQIECLCLY